MKFNEANHGFVWTKSLLLYCFPFLVFCEEIDKKMTNLPAGNQRVEKRVGRCKSRIAMDDEKPFQVKVQEIVVLSERLVGSNSVTWQVTPRLAPLKRLSSSLPLSLV